MENGLSIAKLMDVLRNRAVSGLTPKIASMFVLDPLLQVMPDTSSILEKRKNWAFLEKELGKFGIGFEPETRRNLIVGDAKSIVEFVAFLVDFYRGGACTNIGVLLQTTAMQQMQSLLAMAMIQSAAGGPKAF